MRNLALMISGILCLAFVGGLAVALNPLDNDDWDQDPDMDGLNNREEFSAGSDPNNWDSDGDGLPDGWEMENQMDPTDPTDSELDNDYYGGEEYATYSQVDPPYTNYDEYYRLYGIDAETGENLYRATNPNDEDTDGDAILDPDDSWPWDFGTKGGSGGGGGSSASNPGQMDEPPKDTDGDGMLDWAEAFIGTDPFNPDTDGDGLSDPQEISRDLDPNDWDTDNDLLIDGVEEGGGTSTDGHLQDSDSDGLPDPWEDNDNDNILNIEEQNIVQWWWIFMLPPDAGGAGMDPYYGYLIAYRGASLIGMNPNTNDTDADQIADEYETQAYAPGPINKNSRSEYNYRQVTNETGGGRWVPDRWNKEHDLKNPNSGFSVWTDNQFAWYEYWFTKSFEYGVLPVNSYSVVLYNINPWLWWYLMYDGMVNAGITDVDLFLQYYMHSSATINTYKQYTTADDIFGWMDRGAAPVDPKRYRWNMYDCDPCNADTDSDRMEDNWDPRPTIPDDRLDTCVALYKIGFPQPTGGFKWYWPEFGNENGWDGGQHMVSSVLAPTFVWAVAASPDGTFPHDYFGFPYRIIDSTMNKGMELYMEIIVGIERGNPEADFFTKGWYSFLNVSINFHNATIDVPPEEWGSISENQSYDIDDDCDGDGIPIAADNSPTNPWLYTPNSASYPVFPLTLDKLNQGAIPKEMKFDPYDPSNYVDNVLGLDSTVFPGPNEPYVDPATGKGHSGLKLPFANVSQYPNPFTIRSGTYWFMWSTLTFYTIGFHFMVPEGVMAGWVAMDMRVTSDQNIHVDESFDAFSNILFTNDPGWPYIAY